MAYAYNTFDAWLRGHGFAASLDGTGELRDGTAQSFFASQYTAWLNDLLAFYADALRVRYDLPPDQQFSIILSQNDPTGLPIISGLTAAQIAELFGDTSDFAWGGKHVRYYANSFLLPPDHAPVADNVTANGSEDASPVALTLTASDADTGDAIESFTLTSLPPGETGILYTDATLSHKAEAGVGYTASAGTLTLYFAPHENFNGEVKVNYTASDGELNSAAATATVTLNQQNDPATFGGDLGGSGQEDGGPILGTLMVADAADGMTTPNFHIAPNDGPSSGAAFIDSVSGQWSYTPNTNFNGTDHFTVSVTDDDGNVETQVIDIAVTPVADQPVAVDDAAATAAGVPVTIDVLDNDSDPDLDTLSVSAIAGIAVSSGDTIDVGPGKARLNQDGTITYTPDADASGSASFFYSVQDPAGATAQATVTIDVTPLVTFPTSFSAADVGRIDFEPSGTPQFATVRGVGDFNGDGYADILLTASGASANDGAAYLVLGGSFWGDTQLTFDLDSLVPFGSIEDLGGFVLRGTGGDRFGAGAALGDVDGDGSVDLLIGARQDDSFASNAGAVYLFTDGSIVNSETVISEIGLTPRLFGVPTGAFVTNVGDVTGDGLTDFVISQLFVPGAPELLQPFDPGWSPSPFYVAGSLGPNESQLLSNYGSAVGKPDGDAGDVNGDGIPDAFFETPNALYVVYSGGGDFTEEDAANGLGGFRINAPGGANWSDFNVTYAGAGDLNGDGFGDLAFGLPGDDQAGTDAGAVYVLLGAADGTHTTIVVGDVTRGFVITGADAGDHAGSSVAGAGDINNDGFDDLLVGADGYDPAGRPDAGAAFIVFGVPFSAEGNAAPVAVDDAAATAAGVPVTIDVLDNDSDPDLDTLSVSAIAGVAVLPGDEIDVGPGRARLNAGGTITYTPDADASGSASFFYSVRDPSGATAQAIVTIDVTSAPPPPPPEFFGVPTSFSAAGVGRIDFEPSGTPQFATVRGVGDFNGDGYADILLTASGASANDGAAYLVLGGSFWGDTQLTFDLDSLVPFGSIEDLGGFVLRGTGGDRFGAGAALGDVDGDGSVDLLIGARQDDSFASNAGAVYLFTDGSIVNSETVISEIGLTPRLFGVPTGAFVTNVGDVTGDGLTDFVISQLFVPGAPELLQPFDPGWSPSPFYVAGSLGPNESQLLSNYGSAVGKPDGDAGDVNGDGIPDAFFETPNALYVVYSGGGDFTEEDAANGLGGFRINAPGGANWSDFNVTYAGAGDLNGDGFGDLAFGLPGDDQAGTDAGAVYVLLGAADGTHTTIVVGDVTRGFVITGADAGDHAGSSVAGAGDINNDGFDDLLVGADGYDPAGRPDAGAAFIVFGDSWRAEGTAGADQFFFNSPDEPLRYIEFDPSLDALHVSASGFGGGLVAGGDVTLVSNASPTASGLGGQFLYDTDDGALFWDPDGSGDLPPLPIAILVGAPTPTQDNFFVIA